MPMHARQVRYLMNSKYRRHTGTWYANNFRAVVDRTDAITFDASPTTFNNFDLAVGWISKWLPEAKTAC